MLPEQDWRSNRRYDGQRVSQLSPTPAHSSPVVATAAGPSNQANPRRFQAALDESARAYRTTALRQLNGNPRPWPRGYHRQPSTATGTNKHSGGRGQSSSGLVSQPVLVRTYSGNGNTGENKSTEARNRKIRASTPCRSFPFLGGYSREMRNQNAAPKLPSAEEFSIEGVLRAIEPNIQHTLDSIAEIYGRSKLSLANEYESHIAPLGEIRAPPASGSGYHHLVTVDEVSSEQERQQQQEDGDDVDLYDDDMGQYTQGLSSSGIRAQEVMPSGDRSSVQAEPDTPRSSTETIPGLGPLVADVGAMPVLKDFASRPRSCGKALLGKTTQSTLDAQVQRIITPAVVSEVHLDAQAENSQPADLDPIPHVREVRNSGSWFSGIDFQAFLSWFAGAQSDSRPWQSAEMQLRGLLDNRREGYLYHGI